jgi:hypothetical protein
MLCGFPLIYPDKRETTMSDRFPYNLPSREALVRLAREDTNEDIQSEHVNFEDMFFSPRPEIPGRTFIEMVNNRTKHKFWFVYRRLDMALVIGPNAHFKIDGLPTPANIAHEINRSRNMTFGPDDISFSNTVINATDDIFTYRLKAMTGSYAYFGEVDIEIELVGGNQYARFLETGEYRLTEAGLVREFDR